MSSRRTDVFESDRHMPTKRMGLSARFHHNEKGKEEFEEGQVVDDATRMGLHKGGSGIHIHHRNTLTSGQAENLLKKRGALSAKGRVYEVIDASSRTNQSDSAHGHFIRFREDDIGKDVVTRPPRLLGRTIHIWGIPIEF